MFSVWTASLVWFNINFIFVNFDSDHKKDPMDDSLPEYMYHESLSLGGRRLNVAEAW